MPAYSAFPNLFRQNLRAGRRLIGCWCSLASPISTEVLGVAGFDWLLLDGEHAPNDVASFIPQLMALKDSASAPVVRPQWNDAVCIKRLLDAGFYNFLIPFVESADDARRAVSATRYPPQGVRGVSVSHRSNRYGTVTDYFQTINDNIAVVVQIESAKAVAAIDEIATVNGVDGLFIGPSDLAAGCGHLGDPDHTDVQAAMRSVFAAASTHSKPVGILAPLEADARRYLDMGASFVAVGSDLGVLRTATQALRDKFSEYFFEGEQNVSKLGFVGLGIMGTPMAEHLIKAGHEVFLHSIPAIPASLVEAGGKACTCGREVAEKAEIIFIMVPDTPHVGAALFDAGGIAEGLSPAKTVVNMSSISPIETRDYAQRVRSKGCEYLDAPVSGGEVGAKAATLTIMVGGTEETFARVKPLFELMGKNITLVGDTGAGQITKVANQIIVALTIEAVGEALLLAAKAGADPARVRQALMGGFASSRILEVHGERMVKRTFNPGFRIELHQKDLNLALATARKLGVALPNTATAQELFNSCAAHGGSGWDHSAMVRALEKMANFEIAAG